MSFWDHLDALRGVLIRMAVVVCVATIGMFCVMPWVFDHVILAPCRPDFPTYRLFQSLSDVYGASAGLMPDFSAADFHVSLINYQLASQFFIHMSSSFQTALVLTFPILIYLLWTFVSPALYPEEKRNATSAFVMGNLMFYSGVAVGYFLVFPLALRFLADYQLSELVPNTISLDSYMDNFTTIVLLMGVVFELPLLTWLLGKIGVVTRSIFSRYRRHAIVTLMILAALITPTGDPFTLIVVFLPLYLLWELSAWTVPNQKIQKKV